jgi:hypothetical protein
MSDRAVLRTINGCCAAGLVTVALLAFGCGDAGQLPTAEIEAQIEAELPDQLQAEESATAVAVEGVECIRKSAVDAVCIATIADDGQGGEATADVKVDVAQDQQKFVWKVESLHPTGTPDAASSTEAEDRPAPPGVDQACDLPTYDDRVARLWVNEVTSCDFASEVATQLADQEPAGAEPVEFTTASPVTDKDYEMFCDRLAEMTYLCTGGTDAEIVIKLDPGEG